MFFCECVLMVHACVLQINRIVTKTFLVCLHFRVCKIFRIVFSCNQFVCKLFCVWRNFANSLEALNMRV